jgi:hypothetical protein
MASANEELARKFRVLGQSVSMHSALADAYAQRALLVDVVLLSCSVVFCATVISNDEFFNRQGLDPQAVRDVRAVASVLSFLAAVVSLRVDWKGASARHRESARKLSSAIAQFRAARLASGTWPDSAGSELDRAYHDANAACVPIQEKHFLKLKAHHLRKVEVSKMLDRYPGCPLLILRYRLWLTGCRGQGGADAEKVKDGHDSI